MSILKEVSGVADAVGSKDVNSVCDGDRGGRCRIRR